MTLLIFNGQAESALHFYISIFAGANIVYLKKYTAAGPGPEGTIRQAQFSLGGTQYLCMDQQPGKPFHLTRAVSLYVRCGSLQELEEHFRQLSDRGHVWMAPASYAFSNHFCWVRDRFGVSWQLDVPFSEQEAGDHNLCYANSPEVRPDYRN